MSSRLRGGATLLAAVLAVACSTGSVDRESPATVDSATRARAAAAADDLGRDLMSLLTSELRRGGPEAAVAVCADSAQARTARHGTSGLAVRRVGTRVRSPANAPDSLERLVLEAFSRTLAAGGAPADTAFVAVGAEGAPELRFLRPVRVAEPCLACHGPRELQPLAVRRLLAERYPADQAVDYRVGDLRGAVSVRVRLGR